ncbi:ABC transporter substrate-binding protein [Parafrankia sp. EUN1f]|uniref:ABC transporter substrate-binding protein n=1 Tax=Parafrankia sp. EUN1f TaxID=102897 RepID=UPI00350F12E0
MGNFPTSALTLPFAVAQEQGFFRDAGLNVTTVKAKSGPELLAGLIGGTTQIAVAVPPTPSPRCSRENRSSPCRPSAGSTWRWSRPPPAESPTSTHWWARRSG